MTEKKDNFKIAAEAKPSDPVPVKKAEVEVEKIQGNINKGTLLVRNVNKRSEVKLIPEEHVRYDGDIPKKKFKVVQSIWDKADLPAFRKNK